MMSLSLWLSGVPRVKKFTVSFKSAWFINHGRVKPALPLSTQSSQLPSSVKVACRGTQRWNVAAHSSRSNLVPLCYQLPETSGWTANPLEQYLIFGSKIDPRLQLMLQIQKKCLSVTTWWQKEPQNGCNPIRTYLVSQINYSGPNVRVDTYRFGICIILVVSWIMLL